MYAHHVGSSVVPKYLCSLFCLTLVGCGASPDNDSSALGSGGNGGQATGGHAGTSQAGTSGGGGSAGSAGASAAGSSTGGNAGTSNGGSAGSSAAGSTGVSSKCESPVGPGLPEGAPALEVGVWKDISPPGLDWGNGPFTQGMAVDPCNPAVLYVTSDAFDVALGGLWKSLDAGGTWTRIGLVDGGPQMLDEPIRVRIDPDDTQHLYVGDGVRGATMGFFVSTDGGANFQTPQGFKDLKTDPGMYQYDVYDVAVDPTDFDHVLVAFHGAWGWTDTEWNTSSGILESSDGGESWTVHAPDGWGTGHAINFLYQPELGLGDASTWLLGTQGGRMLRTTDAGGTWSESQNGGIQHGGGTIYYAQNGDLYASGAASNQRSTDNGMTWNAVGPGGGYNGIGGDGKNIYSSKCFGPTHMITTPESDGQNWTDFNSQEFDSGSFEMVFDPINGILYSASWGSGLLALKVE